MNAGGGRQLGEADGDRHAAGRAALGARVRTARRQRQQNADARPHASDIR